MSNWRTRIIVVVGVVVVLGAVAFVSDPNLMRAQPKPIQPVSVSNSTPKADLTSVEEVSPIPSNDDKFFVGADGQVVARTLWMDPNGSTGPAPHEAVPPGPAMGEAQIIGQQNAVNEPRTVGPKGRVAVVVASSIYPAIIDSINTYLSDLDRGGYSTVLVLFSGNAEYLRNTLANLYNQPDSLVGAVLVGNLPYVIFEEGNYEDFPYDLYFMDLNGTWSDILNAPPVLPNNGKLDTWTGDRNLEIWVSRLKTDLLPGLGTEADLLNSYFARNHALRWNTLNTGQTALAYYGSDEFTSSATGDSNNLSSVFGSSNVTSITDPNVTSGADYLDQLQNGGHHLVLLRAHGSEVTHTINGPCTPCYIMGFHYIDYHASPMFFHLYSCSLCDFSYGGLAPQHNCGGMILFNPNGNALLAWGSTKIGGMEYDNKTGSSYSKHFYDYKDYVLAQKGYNDNQEPDTESQF